MDEQNQTKFAFACITGAPNVGKSSILNKILGQKVAIVTPKPQTTRTTILGIHTEGNTQIAFTDTPGLLLPKDALSRNMVKSIQNAASGSDIVILVAEAGKKPKPAELSVIENLNKQKLPAILVINKIDLLKQKERMIPQMDAFSKLYTFNEILPVSAVSGDGVKDILSAVSKLAKPGPFMYDSDELTDQPERVICAEYIREQILNYMQQEIPHGVAVVIERFEETSEGIDADANIYCERDSHKGMLIGKNGQMLKQIRKSAQSALKDFFGVPVSLELWVKVKPDWRENEALIKNFGLNFEG
ncbi:MAG TPA: GTPase Era [Oscillospiraceae bacterium]|nr:GTPase Era [Oscillospiraceae bacterium]HPF56208.1 GTPase Era [Clostridiales bacterium]HPK36623.1 GTPase Era [Oscillospiraceae bacterium]HPR76837.1 GTPase Era [Oscillospiraceae bacterium]